MTNGTTLSRRGFAKTIGSGVAYAALGPTADLKGSWGSWLPEVTSKYSEAGVVRLSSNENPYGPSPASLKAMTDGFSLAWRYPDEHADMLTAELAKLHNVPVDHVLLGDGSGEILKLSATAFTRDKKLVIGNPTFEAIAHHAAVANGEVVKIDLTSDYRHDLQKMLAAASAGLVYICNPNNPTASITPKKEMAEFLSKLNRETIVLVDEAYHHYVESNDYESVIPLVKDNPNLIVARTFSKVYGMAGLRCGYCVTRSENIKLMRVHQIFDSVNIMAVVAALAGLKDPNHVTQGRKLNSDVRKAVYVQLDTLGYRYIPSHANFMMIDLRREAKPVIDALRKRGVEVGRVFPAMPTFMRVTIGTSSQMKAFLTTFQEVMV